MTTNRPLRRALVSVYHKEGIEVLAQAFIQAGTEVVSTGSTAAKLKELGVQVTEVSQVTAQRLSFVLAEILESPPSCSPYVGVWHGTRPIPIPPQPSPLARTK